MILKIKLIPNSSVNKVVAKDGDNWRIKIMTPPIEGKANQALIKLLAEEFGVAKNKIKIVSGEKSREKVLEVNK